MEDFFNLTSDSLVKNSAIQLKSTVAQVLQQLKCLSNPISRAGQVRKLVRKSANPQLRTNEKSCGHADLRTLAV